LPAVADFVSAPFYDLFHDSGHVPKIRAALPPLLAGVRGNIVEIGAGTGLLTTSLADLTPAEIFALEPSASMRAVLLSRLSSRPELLSRVTVLPCDALSIRLDEPAQAVVMINVMYAFEPDYRRRLWPVLAGVLETGALLVFTWRDGGSPAPHQAHVRGLVGDPRLRRGGLPCSLPLPDHRRRQGHQRRRDHRLLLPADVGRAAARAGGHGIRPG
jgi:hypothetical protein